MAVVYTRCGSNILADILKWSGDLPGWQRDALRRLVENGAITRDDIVELAALCKHAHGLEVDCVPELRPLEREHVPKGSVPGKALPAELIA